ncbi:MAG: hypothetical protein ACTSXF_15180, partial [Promethearchaeota archaeon]
MHKKKIIGLLLLSVLVFNFGSMILVQAAGTKTLQETNDLTQTLSSDIIHYYLEARVKDDGGTLKGSGYDDNGRFVYPSSPKVPTYSVENLLALTALSSAFNAFGESALNKWTTEDIWPAISVLFSQSKAIYGILHDDTGDNDDIRITYDQFMMLDSLSQYYIQTQDDQVYSKIKSFYDVISFYEANTTSGYYGKEGGYWTQIIGVNGLKDKNDDGDYYKYCQSINSFLAAAALSRFAIAITNHYDNQDGTLKRNILALAEKSIIYPEQYAKVGPFYIEFDIGSSGKIHFKTQAMALYAFAMLYKATNKASYLYKANALLQELSMYFWDAGRGGFMNLIDLSFLRPVDDEDAMKNGFSNILAATATFELFKASGDAKFLGYTEDIMNFMYNNMWLETGKDVRGYVEWIARNGTLMVPASYAAQSVTNTSRFIDTNMMALNLNSQLYMELRPWYLKYTTELIIGA